MKTESQFKLCSLQDMGILLEEFTSIFNSFQSTYRTKQKL